VREIEQFANLLSRAAVQSWRDRKADLDTCVKQVQEAQRWLTWLSDERGGGRSAERLSLLAGVNKRLALMCESARAALPHVHAMVAGYAQASEWSQQGGATLDPYPLVNALFGDLVEQWLSRRSRRRSVLGKNRLADARAAAASSAEFDFWKEAVRIDCDLLDALQTANETAWPTLADGYRALRRLSSRREFGSVLDQIEFLLRMATLANRESEQARLQALRDALAPAGPPGEPAAATQGSRPVRRSRRAPRKRK
jgi:hypothetical protein